MRYLIIIFLFSCNSKSTPKFKVGDCVQYITNCEFLCIASVKRILKVGKTHYLYRFGESKSLVSESEYIILDNYDTKIDSDKCTKKGY